jgi:hypothetical protein
VRGLLQESHQNRDTRENTISAERESSNLCPCFYTTKVIKKIMKTTKEKEIRAIRDLIEMDGYFAERFKGDQEKMIENIQKDFPIELGTNFNASAECQQAINDKLMEEHANEIADLVDTLLCVHEKTGNERLYEHAIEKLGMRNVIARKHILGLKITSVEIGFLLHNKN